MSTKDGGPAFPDKKRVFRDGYSTSEFEPVPGMTLRDYFAAEALAGVPKPLNTLHDVEAAYLRTATHCYRMADAMLVVRKLPRLCFVRAVPVGLLKAREA